MGKQKARSTKLPNKIPAVVCGKERLESKSCIKSNTKSENKKKFNRQTNKNKTTRDSCISSSIRSDSSTKKKSALQESFLKRLSGSRFRELNEDLYTHSSNDSFQRFTSNPELY